MKKVLLICGLLMAFATSWAQDEAICRQTAEKFFSSFPPNSSDWVNSVLTEDFTLGAYPQAQSRPVLNAVLKQPVMIPTNSIALIESSAVEGNLSLVYQHGKDGSDATFAATFVFTPDNKLKHLDWNLFQAKVVNAAPDAECSLSPVSLVRFERIGDHIGVTAKINGEDKLFYLDTGAGVTILNSNIAESDAIGGGSGMGTINATAQSQGQLGVKRVGSFDFYGVKITDHEFVTKDLSHLQVDEREVYGLIGYDVLNHFDILFNYDRSTLQLINPIHTESVVGAMRGQGIETFDIPFTMKNHLPILSGKIGAIDVEMAFDCGAGANVVSSTSSKGLTATLSNLQETDVTDGSSSATYAKGTASFSFNGRDFGEMPTVSTDLSHLGIEAMLGIPLLQGRKVLLSYSTNQMLIL